MAGGMTVPEYRDNFASSEWISAMSPQATMTIVNANGATFIIKKQEDDIIINGTTVTSANWESAVNGENVNLGEIELGKKLRKYHNSAFPMIL